MKKLGKCKGCDRPFSKVRCCCGSTSVDGKAYIDAYCASCCPNQLDGHRK